MVGGTRLASPRCRHAAAVQLAGRPANSGAEHDDGCVAWESGHRRSPEVRWIFPGQLETVVAGWFGRFPAGTESREDTYLLDPQLRGLSVKVRGGGALEVKLYRGSPGILEVAGRARGRLESWSAVWPGEVPSTPAPRALVGAGIKPAAASYSRTR
jgi:hypothetical protein